MKATHTWSNGSIWSARQVGICDHYHFLSDVNTIKQELEVVGVGATVLETLLMNVYSRLLCSWQEAEFRKDHWPREGEVLLFLLAGS